MARVAVKCVSIMDTGDTFGELILHQLPQSGLNHIAVSLYFVAACSLSGFPEKHRSLSWRYDC